MAMSATSARVPKCATASPTTAPVNASTAFGQQLAQQPPPACADRQSDRQFTVARFGAGEKKVRHVGARNQQDQRDAGHQCQQCAAITASDFTESSFRGPDEERTGHVLLLVFVAPVLGNGLFIRWTRDRGQACTGLPDVDIRGKPTQDTEPPVAPVIEAMLRPADDGLRADRHVHV